MAAPIAKKAVSTATTAVKKVVSTAATAVKNTATAAISSVKNAASSFASGVKGLVGGLFKKSAPAPASSKIDLQLFGGKSTKFTPNPNGKAGGLAHQNKIGEVVNDLENKGYTVTREYKVNTPGGYKNTRYGDAYGKNHSTGDEVIVQVGKQTKSGQPVSRERKAISDLENYGGYKGRVKYIPYD